MMVTHRSSLSPSLAVFQGECHAEPLSRAEGICSERHYRRPPPPAPLPPSQAMELKVWVDGVVRVVCGLSEETSCQDVVIALAQAIGEFGNFPHCEIAATLCGQTGGPSCCLQLICFFCPLKCCLHNSPAEQIYCKQSVAAPRRKAGVAGFSPLSPTHLFTLR